MPQDDKIIQKIKEFPRQKVLVVGDMMLDKFTYGDISRISPEAPVPVLKKIADKYILGGAGNVASNIKALGAQVFLVSMVGADEAKIRVFSLLKKAKLSSRSVLVSKDGSTTIKQRFVVGSTQQLLRLDEESTEEMNLKEETAFLKQLKKVIPECDIIIVSDYCKGCITFNIARELIKLAKKHKKRVIVDTKPMHRDFFLGADIFTPNIKEAQEMSGEENVEEAGKKLAKLLKATILLTRSSEGMTIFNKDNLVQHVPAKSAHRVFDVTGAGDTVVAILALSLASGLNLKESAELANNAGSIVVQKPGTSVLSAAELISSLAEIDNVATTKIVPKVWGYEKWLENNEKYCCKILVIKKDFQCSLHFHKIKDETFLLVKGYLQMEVNKKTIYLKPGDYIRIKPGDKHRFTGLEESEILEISTHHEEKDSYRLIKSRRVLVK